MEFGGVGGVGGALCNFIVSSELCEDFVFDWFVYELVCVCVCVCVCRSVCVWEELEGVSCVLSLFACEYLWVCVCVCVCLCVYNRG